MIFVYYHSNCPDGFGAAWAFYQKFGHDANYIPVSYDNYREVLNYSELKNSSVYILDFHFDVDVMDELDDVCSSVTLIDHHKSAEEKLKGRHNCIIDKTHSGCYLAWKYLFGESNVAPILKYIEDRDLWKWEFEESKFILTTLDSYPYDFEIWNKFNKKLSSKEKSSIVSSGIDIQRYKESQIKKISKFSEHHNICGYNLYIINTSILQSDVCNYILQSKQSDIAIAYFRNNNSYKCSIRVARDDIDASLIARNFGGGGHVKAAGFSVCSVQNLLDKEKYIF
ncbi:DHHA1 domain-containing protein [bacterium]|nr:DHHA1 domain-containing protein [bacterium]